MGRRGCPCVRCRHVVVRDSTVDTDRDRVEKLTGLLRLGEIWPRYSSGWKIRDHPYGGLLAKTCNYSHTSESSGSEESFIGPTTAHWEWRDGGSSMYPRGRRTWIGVVYCTSGWRRTGPNLGGIVVDELAYASLGATYAVWIGILSWVLFIRINVAPRLWRLGHWLSTESGSQLGMFWNVKWIMDNEELRNAWIFPK